MRSEGRNPAQGSRGFGAPQGPRNSTPRFSNSGSRKPLPRGPLKALRASGKALQGPRRGVSVFKAAGKEGVPLRGPQEAPFSRMPPEGVQKPSGSYPQATDSQQSRPREVGGSSRHMDLAHSDHETDEFVPRHEVPCDSKVLLVIAVAMLWCIHTWPKLRRGPRGASHEKFHAAPSKKQARFLEGPLPLRAQGKSDLLRSPFASKKVLRGTFRGLPPFAPLSKANVTPCSEGVACDPRDRCEHISSTAWAKTVNQCTIFMS